MASPTSGHFDISQLPSLKKGMTVEQEALTRVKTCRFIEEAGRILKFPRIAVSTAMVFFHRFYAKHSFQDHDRFEVAVAAVLLAGKTEEYPRKLNQVIDECYKLKVRGMQAGRISTHGSAVPASTSLDPKSDEFSKLKDRVLLMERVILHTIGFELSIDHPYTFIVEIISKLMNGKKVEFVNPPVGLTGSAISNKLKNDITQYALGYANDSMQTTLCLQFPPQKIAAAVVYLSALFAKAKPTEGKEWLEILEHSDFGSMTSISVQIIDLLLQRKGAHRETLEKIKNEIQLLRTNSAAEEPSGKRLRTV